MMIIGIALICVTIAYCVTLINVRGGVQITVNKIVKQDYNKHTVEEQPKVEEVQEIGRDTSLKDGERELTDREQRDQMLSDLASTWTAISRGEVDIDEI